MKIALCLSGQPRQFAAGYQCYKKFLLDKYDIDVFIHTWFTPGNYDLYEHGGKYKLDKDIDKKIVDIYNPKKIIIEPQITTFYGNISNNDASVSNFAQYSMYYSMRESNILKKKYEDLMGFKYDVVIRSRFDSAILVDLDLSNLKDNMLYGIDAIDNPNRLCDWFLFGSSNIIDSVCELYNNIENLKNKIEVFCGEELLFTHLMDNKIEYTKLFPNTQGSSLVLIRNNAENLRSRCWKRELDVLRLLNI